MALSAKQQAFVEHYLRCWNASEAARLAGYSEKTAGSIGYENLKKPQISEAIQERLAELKMGTDEVLLRLADHARATMEDFVNPELESVDLMRAAERDKLHLVKKFSRTTTDKSTNISIELYDAQSALVTMAKLLGMMKDEVDHSGRIEVVYVNDWRGTRGDGDD